jgi:hypothetical protein
MRNKHYVVSVAESHTDPNYIVLLKILSVKHYQAARNAEFHPNYATEEEAKIWHEKLLDQLSKEGFTWEVVRVKSI